MTLWPNQIDEATLRISFQVRGSRLGKCGRKFRSDDEKPSPPDAKAPEIGAIVPTVVNDIERMSATATGYDVH